MNFPSPRRWSSSTADIPSARSQMLIDRLREPRSLLLGAIAMLIALAAPPIRQLLEVSMVSQMLAQMPLLALAGWMAAAAVPTGTRAAIERWNRHGVTGLVLATVTGACWMLPRALDAAVAVEAVALAKYASVPFLIGMPLALSWPRMGFVVRGVFLSELIASLFRLGWLYRVSPVRLCSRYPLEDQQRLGLCLLVIGAALFTGVALKLLFGRFGAPENTRAAANAYHQDCAPQHGMRG